MNYVVSIDPGKTSGYALWTSEGEILKSGQLKGENEFFQFLFDNPCSAYVIEGFKLYPHMAEKQLWSAFETVEMIGAVKIMAYRREAECVVQPANIKPMFYKLSGVPVQKDHSKSHRFDAIVHGYKYFYDRKILKGPIA